jgi:hypothetical protein
MFAHISNFRSGEWKLYLEMRRKMRASGTQNLQDFDDEEYCGNITLGTPRPS